MNFFFFENNEAHEIDENPFDGVAQLNDGLI